MPLEKIPLITLLTTITLLLTGCTNTTPTDNLPPSEIQQIILGSWTCQGYNGSIETTNGDVTADMNDHGDNYTFDISTVNGKISIEYGTVDRKGKSIFYGNGDKKFTIDTTNGKVEVTCEP